MPSPHGGQGPEARFPPPVVALAASLGGIAAIGSVLAGLPPDFPGAVLVLQHLSPGKSSLHSLFGGRCALPVKQAEAGERVRGGQVYVAPSDRHLLLGPAGDLGFSDGPRSHFVRPSADLLFQSLSRAVGFRVVAVVLTGSGGDGSGGVGALHASGGIVIAEEPEGAHCRSMPDAAIATGAVDRILPLVLIPFVLVQLVTGFVRA